MKCSLVIPVYNLHGTRIRNLLESISNQSADCETIIIDYGSDTSNHKKLIDTTSSYDVDLTHIPDVEWSPPRACNIGIRKAKEDTIIKIDADLILEPDTVKDTTQKTEEQDCFIIRQPLFLPKQFDYTNLHLPRDYKKLRETKTHYLLPSYGGFFAARKTWWHRVRGYDERYLWYGCNDWDLWNRALKSGLKRIIHGEPGLKGQKGVTPYPKNTLVYHQWHREPVERLGLPVDTFEKHRQRNRGIYNDSQSIQRNDETWGLIS